MLDQLNKDFINLISSRYIEYINQSNIDNKHYFINSGIYGNRILNDEIKQKSDYFNKILFPPNICILEYVIDNIEEFKGLKFFDNGCGVGLLSCFLSKLGLNCYNYDNFSQIKTKLNFNEYISDIIEISPVQDDIFEDDFEVITSSGIWINNPKIFNFKKVKYFMIDMHHINAGLSQEIISVNNLKNVKTYDSLLGVFKKRE